MNKIVFEHYPASKLPDDMREKFGSASIVTVEVTVEDDKSSAARPTLDEIFARRRPPFRSKEEIDAEWRRQRDEWK